MSSELGRRLYALTTVAVIGLLHSVQAAHADERPTPHPNKPLQILFIGNSYTYVNDLPAMLAAMSASPQSPRRIETKMVAQPAATLESLWQQRDALRAIWDLNWDYVVLQEQSTRPVLAPALMSNYAKQFDEAIRGRGAKTLLFVTWAREHYPDMQPKVNDAYSRLARETKAFAVPVGPAWQIAQSIFPSVGLYANDGSHPTQLGTYVAACTFYLVLEPNSSRHCPLLHDEGISVDISNAATEAALRAIAQWR
jgi:hypothetical protein